MLESDGAFCCCVNVNVNVNLPGVQVLSSTFSIADTATHGVML